MSRPYASVRLTTGCNRTLMVVVGGAETCGRVLRCGAGIRASTKTFTLMLFCGLSGVVLSFSCNSEGTVKGMKNYGSLSVLDGDVTVFIGGSATTCSRPSCVIIAATSIKRLSRLAPEAAAVVTVGAAFVT